MVSFGVSATDIKEAVKVCNWLWVNCFDKNNSAGMWNPSAVEPSRVAIWFEKLRY